MDRIYQMERSGERIQVVGARDRGGHSVGKDASLGSMECAGEWAALPRFARGREERQRKLEPGLEAEPNEP